MNRLLQFQMPGRLIFGQGALRELPAAVSRLGGQRVLLVTDPGLVKAGLCQTVVDLLVAAAVSPTVFSRVDPDPPIQNVLDCAAVAREARCDVVIGLGGGSAMDVAKVTAMLMGNPGDIRSYFGIDQVPQRGLPTVMIPTTAGTGSEVSPIAVLSDLSEHSKKGIVSDHLYASLALVDPELTVGLPPNVTAFTGMDALTHAIEAYTNKFAQPFIDTLALEAIRLIGGHLPRAVQQGRDLAAREAMALGSLYGGLCLGAVNTAAVHALAYPLGGTFNVPHGVANSLLLPYVMRFNLPSQAAKFARIAAALGQPIAGHAGRRVQHG